MTLSANSPMGIGERQVPGRLLDGYNISKKSGRILSNITVKSTRLQGFTILAWHFEHVSLLFHSPI